MQTHLENQEKVFTQRESLDSRGMTIVAALLTSFLFNISWWKSLIAWFVAGEILHYVYGVNSAFLQKTGLSPSCA